MLTYFLTCKTMDINFNHKYYNKPFSYLVCEDFLSSKDQDQIIEEIIDLNKSFDVEKVMGGRYQFNTNLLKKILYQKNFTIILIHKKLSSKSRISYFLKKKVNQNFIRSKILKKWSKIPKSNQK